MFDAGGPAEMCSVETNLTVRLPPLGFPKKHLVRKHAISLSQVLGLCLRQRLIGIVEPLCCVPGNTGRRGNGWRCPGRPPVRQLAEGTGDEG